MRRLIIHLVVTLAIVPLSLPAIAQPASTPIDPRAAFSLEAKPGMRLEEYIKRMRVFHRRTDVNADAVVSNADLDYYRSDAAASARAGFIGELLRYDLDGDGIVTRAEVVQAETRRIRIEARQDPGGAKVGYSIPQKIDRAADDRMRADLNKDGRIDWSEMLAFAKQAPIHDMRQYESTHRMIMSLDEDGDGAVTIEELDRGAPRVFGSIDVDKDGILSSNEIEALAEPEAQFMRAAEKRAQEREAKKKQDCALPKPSDTATVVLLDAHGADALSTAAIGSQWIATEAGSIDIEPGTGPLYVVVASYNPVIWQLSGAVDRIERLVLAGESTGINQSLPGEKPLIGATGVPSDRIVFLGQAGCMTYHAGPSVVSTDAPAAAVRRETGRAAIVIQPRKQNVTDRAALPDELRRFHPGGIVEVDPRTVVASKRVERYEVMPQEAGLTQLERDGVITRNSLGEFLVHKKIRFPAGLHGAHLVRFRIQKGTPMPEGDPGHSCVIVEETGMALYNGATCDGPFGLKR